MNIIQIFNFTIVFLNVIKKFNFRLIENFNTPEYQFFLVLY